jgi:hypothetical protein
VRTTIFHEPPPDGGGSLLLEGDLVRHVQLGVLMTVLAVRKSGITCIRPPSSAREHTRTEVFAPEQLERVPDAALWC